MTRAIVIFCAALLIAASLLYEDKSTIPVPEIEYPALSFNEVRVRHYSVGIPFPHEQFFSGPSEIRIHSNGGIAINSPATIGWIYGALNDEQIKQTLSEINNANFRRTEKRGYCDSHNIGYEVEIIIGKEKHEYSDCATVVPVKLYAFADEIFQISKEFITNTFIDLGINGNARAAFELSYKFAPKQNKKIYEAVEKNEAQMKEAYFWAFVAHLNPRTKGNHLHRNSSLLSEQIYNSRVRALEQELDGEALSEVYVRIEDWRKNYLNNFKPSQGDNK